MTARVAAPLRIRGKQRVIWAVRVYPDTFNKADQVLALPHIVDKDRSQLLRRYIAEGMSRDLGVKP